MKARNNRKWRLPILHKSDSPEIHELQIKNNSVDKVIFFDQEKSIEIPDNVQIDHIVSTDEDITYENQCLELIEIIRKKRLEIISKLNLLK